MSTTSPSDEESFKGFSMEERMIVIGILNDLMGHRLKTFSLEMAAELIGIMPFVEHQEKWPFFGRQERRNGVEGYVPGIGNVQVPDTPSDAAGADSNQSLEFRFGVWDLAHKEGKIVIDHMWSHHILSSTYAGKRAYLVYTRCAPCGRLNAAILAVEEDPSDFFPRLIVWKRDDSLTKEEAERILGPSHAPVKRVGVGWLAATAAVCAYFMVLNLQERLGMPFEMHLCVYFSVIIVIEIANYILRRLTGYQLTLVAAMLWAFPITQLLMLAVFLLTRA